MGYKYFSKLPEDIQNLINGKSEKVCLVEDNNISKDGTTGLEPEWFNREVSKIANQARKNFDQKLEEKLEYLVANCGREILDHIRIVMEPMMFSLSEAGMFDPDNYNYTVTTQARIEYFLEGEVVE